MSKAVNKVLETALKEVGATSGKKYNLWYWGADNGAAWCAAFASWVMNQCGFGGIAGKYASCTTWRNNFLNPKGIWLHKSKTDPRPGDLVFYNWDGKTGTADTLHHVG
ncbi:MAG: CHAP domain-containing protein, partial [Oscillospiraceae bacterium]|nr:CHAP domain-containing protein [Oscillospiraceae bacterium]